MARRKVNATLDDFARAVLIVHEAMYRAEEVCGWTSRDSLFEAAERLHDRNVKVVNE